MKKVLSFLVFAFVCNITTAQTSTDFYVDLSKSAASDSVRIGVAVPFHMNIGYEVIEVEIKAKGAETGTTFKMSSRFPKGVANNLNQYIFAIPYKVLEGVQYEVVIQNRKLCNTGPFKIIEEFSSENIHTFSYANPGYKLTGSVKQK